MDDLWKFPSSLKKAGLTVSQRIFLGLTMSEACGSKQSKRWPMVDVVVSAMNSSPGINIPGPMAECYPPTGLSWDFMGLAVG